MIDKKIIFSFTFVLFLLILTEIKAEDNLYFLSLKNNIVNLRQGPSFDYPIKFIYKKKYLPVIIIDKLQTWRKIIDFENNSGWIHVSQLSKKNSAINKNNNTIIYNRSTIFSKPIVKVNKGRLLTITKCKKNWCKVKTGSFVGWIDNKNLWGRF
jgi:SH3-like domain-containing protein